MITDKKDLRGGRTPWRDGPGVSVRTRVKLERERCDVAIVGGGVSGALIALSLANEGFDVVVVDRRKPGCGSTAASTALLQFELDTPLRELADKIGHRRAARAYRRSFQAVANLKAFIADNKIKCELRDRDALYLSGDKLGWKALQMEAAARKKIGLPSTFLDAKELKSEFGIERTGAILSHGAGQLNPARLSAGALLAVWRRGGRIYSHQEVVEIDAKRDRVRLHTSRGGQIDCLKAVFATGYETIDDLPKKDFSITSSWAIATKPVKPAKLWPSRCLIWEASDPYLYVRTPAGNRVLAGGEDSELNDAERRDAAIPNKAAKILATLNGLFPERQFELDYAWGGAFAESPTGLPIFYEIEGAPQCMSILGCGGNGITFSMVAAEVVTAWAAGRRDPDAALFDGADR